MYRKGEKMPCRMCGVDTPPPKSAIIPPYPPPFCPAQVNSWNEKRSVIETERKEKAAFRGCCCGGGGLVVV